MAETKRLLHIADYMEYVASHPADSDAAAFAKLTGLRTILQVPMLKDHDLVGAVVIYRTEVRRFCDREVALLKDFAAQAVVAIENARLLNELRQRTADLSEALEQQTAASQVLQIINSSPGELLPVFKAMLENATRICEAKFGVLYRYDENGFEPTVLSNAPPAYASFVWARGQFFPQKGNGLDRLLRTKTVIHSVDEATEPIPTNSARLGGARSQVMVPMLQEDKLTGAIAIYRQEVHPFTDKQIELVKNFAAQAVIAIENARLLNELRQRTTDLTEALKQQKATSDLLQVISGFPGNLEPVFQAMLENAVSICGANFGNMFLYEDDAFRTVAMYNAPEAYAKARTSGAFVPPSDSLLGRLVATKGVAQVADLRAEQRYIDRHPHTVEAVELADIRTALAVPMLREGHLIGGIVIFRQEVHPFNEKQIELVKNFASQVVIAIGNARLLNELRERTEDVVRLNEQLEQRVTDQVGEIERMSRLRRFLPPQVADLIVALGADKQLESHRREITALFCDLRGFTGFTESADAEDVMALLRDYHAAIGEIIIKYNGTLERYAGDGVMVVFNDPVPVENPALQAVLMALEVREAIGALTERWHRWGHDLGFGIGIAHGFATLGTIGFEGRFDYAAIGTVSNVASRLCDEAKPGQILISARVLTKVENAVKVEPVGEFELKGIRRPLAAYNVVAAVS
jgi:adenylate cyclase